jgi:hypothetical protein
MAKKINKKNLSPMYRVISDGTISGTNIYDPFGKKMGRVTRVVWELSTTDAVSKLHIDIVGAEIDAVGEPYITRRVNKQ